MNGRESWSYINDFLYFVLRPDRNRAGALIYCSGVNVSFFSPLVRGRHGICSNPAVRGLQLVNHGVRGLALSKGATPRAFRGKDCAGTAPTRDTWYTEILLIENAPASFPGELIEYCVVSLVKKVFKAAMLGFDPPEELLEEDELKTFLETICKRIEEG